MTVTISDGVNTGATIAYTIALSDTNDQTPAVTVNANYATDEETTVFQTSRSSTQTPRAPTTAPSAGTTPPSSPAP